MGEDKDDNVISFAKAKDAERTYEKTIIENKRRYGPGHCPHKGPYLFDQTLATVECGDCGSLLNPLFVIEVLANREAYWNRRQKELAEYLGQINEEIKERTRTKCTHCGNMTAIRFKKEMPQTWHPGPY